MQTHLYHQRDLSAYSFLVTGGAGFIGSHIVDYLLKHNAHKVRVLDDLSTGSIHNVERFQDRTNYEFLRGDMRDLTICLQACKGIDFISHQAALGSVTRSVARPLDTNSVNVNGFINMLQAAREQKVKRFVFASSSSVYGDSAELPKVESRRGMPISPYAVSKVTNELYAHVFAQVYGMEIIGFRYFNIFGPRQLVGGPYAAVIPLFINGLMSGKPIYIYGDGWQTRDFTYVDNAVQANIRAMVNASAEACGEIYNIAVGKRYSVRDLFEFVRMELNSEQQAIYKPERTGDIRDSLADISKAKRLLNYEPVVHFHEGLTKTIAYFKAQAHLLPANGHFG